LGNPLYSVCNWNVMGNPTFLSLIASSYTQNVMGNPTFLSLIASSYIQNIMGYPTFLSLIAIRDRKVG
jgi:hypothetical protein